MLFFQAEDGIRDLVRSRGLGDVYKRQFFGCVNVANGSNAGLTPTSAKFGFTNDFFVAVTLIFIVRPGWHLKK